MSMDDAENVLDQFSFEALRRKAMSGNNSKVSKEVQLFFSSSNQLVFRRSMAYRINNLRTRLDGIAADSRNFGLVEHRPERAVVIEERQRQTHSHPPQVVVGRDGDRDTVVQLLLSEDFRLEICLKEKEHLQCLTLDWKSAVFSTKGEDEMTQALEALEPHRNLKLLIVVGNGGSNFPKWLSCLTNLVEIQIKWCQKCRYIPPLHQLPYLQRLVLFQLEALVYLDSGNSTQTTSYFFPSLEVLHLQDCQNLKGWRRPSTTRLESFPRFPVLSHLLIDDCPSLTSMPLFPPLKSLKFGGGSVKSLQEILKATVTTEDIGSSLAAAAASSFSAALSQLQELRISKIEDLEFLPEEFLCHLGSLKTLTISWCHKLKAVGPAVGYLTSLETFSLDWCTSLELSENELDDQVMHWQALKSLSLRGMKFESLPKWLRHLKTIQELHIAFCHRLVLLPIWLVELTSLERLVIYGENLSRRCGSNKGEDWPCICHIPNIKVDDTVVKRRGRYLL